MLVHALRDGSPPSLPGNHPGWPFIAELGLGFIDFIDFVVDSMLPLEPVPDRSSAEETDCFFGRAEAA